MLHSGVILSRKEYRLQLESAAERYKDAPWLQGVEGLERERKLRNVLSCEKIWERADYGPLADVRELIALRIAPWLGSHARR